MDTPKVKGTIYSQARLWVDGHLGSGSFTRAMAAAGATAPELILAGSWYPVEPMLIVLGNVGATRGLSRVDVITQVARMNALADLTSVYRIFLRIAAPQRVLGQAPRVWSLYANFAKPDVAKNDPGHFIGTVDNVPPSLVDFSLGACLGFLPAAVELAGGKSVAARILDPDPAHVRFELRYR